MPRPRGKSFTETERIAYRDKVFSLHAARKSNNEIARELDIDDHTVAKLIKDAYNEISLPKIEDALRQDLELLQQTIRVAESRYHETKDPKDYDALDKMLTRRAKMLGYDAPEKLSVTHVEITQQDIALSELLNEQKAKNAAIEQQLKSIGESNDQLSH